MARGASTPYAPRVASSTLRRPANALYIVATWVPRRTVVEVGALGPVTFDRGWYAYVGSARRGRDARVTRHLRAGKPLRWHADYLLGRFPGRHAWLVDGDLTECELAGALERLPGASRRPPRFGAGDCGCVGHLLRLARRPSTTTLRAVVPEWVAVKRAQVFERA